MGVPTPGFGTPQRTGRRLCRSGRKSSQGSTRGGHTCDISQVAGVDRVVPPLDNPVFTKNHGNNPDSILFVDMSLEYPYHLIVSHEPSGAHLWRTKTFSWDSADWELVSDQYNIGGHYEYDDGGKVSCPGT